MNNKKTHYTISIFLCFMVIMTGPVQAVPFNYLPSKIPGHQVVEYSEFTLSYNEYHEQADWVAYELTKREARARRNRCNCFAIDESVSSDSATLEDYASSGFERGHLSPAADNNITAEANKESFLMSNMSPQLPNFNGGIWQQLEKWIRKQAIKHNKIYVATGPVFQNNLGSIGNNQVTIPGYFYKVVLVFKQSTVKTIGFLIPHVGSTGNIEDYTVPVNTIETLTKIDFFHHLNDRDESQTEYRMSKEFWGLD